MPRSKFFCPTPHTCRIKGESNIDKTSSVLANEYSKPLGPLPCCIGHLRRANGALRPKAEGGFIGCGWQSGWFTWLLDPCCANPIAHRKSTKNIDGENAAAQVLAAQTDPIYGVMLFQAYYESFVKQLVIISPKFAPTTAAGVEELLSFKADM